MIRLVIHAWMPGEDEDLRVAASLCDPRIPLVPSADFLFYREAGPWRTSVFLVPRLARRRLLHLNPNPPWSHEAQSVAQCCHSGSSAVATISSTSSPRASFRMMGEPYRRSVRRRIINDTSRTMRLLGAAWATSAKAGSHRRANCRVRCGSSYFAGFEGSPSVIWRAFFMWVASSRGSTSSERACRTAWVSLAARLLTK